MQKRNVVDDFHNNLIITDNQPCVAIYHFFYNYNWLQTPEKKRYE